MKRKQVPRIVLSAFFLPLIAVTVSAQDFQKSYQLGPGGRIRIQSVSGDVRITGYDGDSITVSGFKEGRDRDLVEIEDLSSGDLLHLRSRYPRDCNCNASVRYEVQVPRSINYRFDRLSTASGNVSVNAVTGEINARSASGNVEIKDVTGSVKASTASGDVEVLEVAGPVSARSASGNVNVEITRLDRAEHMEFSSASGDVTVRLPDNLDAQVEMRTMSGSLETDFPIHIEERRRGPGRSANGQVGSGSGRLTITAASGNVRLKRL